MWLLNYLLLLLSIRQILLHEVHLGVNSIECQNTSQQAFQLNSEGHHVVLKLFDTQPKKTAEKSVEIKLKCPWSLEGDPNLCDFFWKRCLPGSDLSGVLVSMGCRSSSSTSTNSLRFEFEFPAKMGSLGLAGVVELEGLIGFVVGLLGLETTSSIRGSSCDPMLDLWRLHRALCDRGEAPGVSMGVSTTLRSSMDARGAFSLRGSERL